MDNNENQDFNQNESNNSFIVPPFQETNEEPTYKPKSFLPNFDVDPSMRKPIVESNEEVKPESTISSLISNNSTNLYQNEPRVYKVEKEKSNIPIVVLVTVIVLLVSGYFVYTFMEMATKKMVCESTVGTITLTYNKDTIVGYRTDNITYNIYEQRTYADEVGIKQYLDEFENWFKTNTNGTCKR